MWGSTCGEIDFVWANCFKKLRNRRVLRFTLFYLSLICPVGFMMVHHSNKNLQRSNSATALPNFGSMGLLCRVKSLPSLKGAFEFLESI